MEQTMWDCSWINGMSQEPVRALQRREERPTYLEFVAFSQAGNVANFNVENKEVTRRASKVYWGNKDRVRCVIGCMYILST